MQEPDTSETARVQDSVVASGEGIGWRKRWDWVPAEGTAGLEDPGRQGKSCFGGWRR